MSVRPAILTLMTIYQNLLSVCVDERLMTWLMLACSYMKRCQVVCHLHTGRWVLSCFFLHRPAQNLLTQHSWTLKPLFNGLIHLGTQTRTNTFIHGVPKMQMMHRPDTFTGLPLSWACVRQQWGCHSHGVMQGAAPVFPPKSYLETVESPQDFCFLTIAWM